MEVRRQIIVCFIVCCANIIYTTGTESPSKDSSNLKETGCLRGKIMAHKNGDKLKLTVIGKGFWKGHKSIDDETCTEVVKEKGDKGADGKPGNKVIKPRGHGERGKKGEPGLHGVQGERGERGSDGINGQNGTKGEPGKCILKPDRKKQDDYGKSGNAAISCDEFKLDGMRYLNLENSFEVSCQSKKTCILKLQNIDFRGIIINEEVRLSSYNLDLMKVYSLKMSQLSYLMTTTEGFEIELSYSNEIKILKILGWSGITVDITPNILSHGCRGKTKYNGTTTVLQLSCKPTGYLPMDFHIKSKTKTVLIKLNRLCFT